MRKTFFRLFLTVTLCALLVAQCLLAHTEQQTRGPCRTCCVPMAVLPRRNGNDFAGQNSALRSWAAYNTNPQEASFSPGSSLPVERTHLPRLDRTPHSGHQIRRTGHCCYIGHCCCSCCNDRRAGHHIHLGRCSYCNLSRRSLHRSCCGRCLGSHCGTALWQIGRCSQNGQPRRTPEEQQGLRRARPNTSDHSTTERATCTKDFVQVNRDLPLTVK